MQCLRNEVKTRGSLLCLSSDYKLVEMSEQNVRNLRTLSVPPSSSAWQIQIPQSSHKGPK